MIIGRPGERAWVRAFLLGVLLWTPLELPSGVTTLQAIGRGDSQAWVDVVPVVASILIMGALSVFTWWAVERWPLGGHGARAANWLVHLGLLLASAWGYLAAMHLVEAWVGDTDPFRDTLVMALPSMVLAYAFNAAVGAFFSLRERLLAQESRSARLAAQLTQSQLSVLRAQLHPHFFFNTLNAIAELVHRDPDAAGRIVSRLGAFLRYSLEMSEAETVPLRDEVGALQAYLDIVRLRFGDRVTVEMRIDPVALAVPVPPLLLQPLVENALKHGLEPREGPGRLEIVARVEGGTLHLEVRDDGVGLGAAAGTRTGIGLRNTRDRLGQIYGGAAALHVRPRPDGGVVAAVTVPAGTAPAPAHRRTGWRAAIPAAGARPAESG
jgi:two-component system LytT family sensor kinase